MVSDKTERHFFDKTDVDFVVDRKLHQLTDFGVVAPFQYDSVNLDLFKALGLG